MPIYVVAFESKDPVLVTGGADRTARLWNVDPEQVAAYVCATTGDDISRGEWEKYLPNVPYAPPCAR
ncbi:hypothetical protein [Micromonospora sp. KC723]|uniref:hypothetical protein n=1 Tax=Micromonospora sp. KC723 TaxID=2530381 RepID=UPI001046BD8C|nr:hypothetical protein [Micromonospora sp. KC723]TDB78468.1 hypothetical protein E1165_00215 [Micromonospora sp. KC723]